MRLHITPEEHGPGLVVSSAANHMQLFAPSDAIPVNEGPWDQLIASCNGQCLGIRPGDILAWAEQATLETVEELREEGVYV